MPWLFKNSNLPLLCKQKLFEIIEDKTIFQTYKVFRVYSWIEKHGRTLDTKWNLQSSRQRFPSLWDRKPTCGPRKAIKSQKSDRLQSRYMFFCFKTIQFLILLQGPEIFFYAEGGPALQKSLGNRCSKPSGTRLVC
ncbi:hypothetical protein AVEN_200515-1, partial [Araneus ventricosus]